MIDDMEYIWFDYSKLRGRIKEIFEFEVTFAKALGMSKTSLSMKLNGKGDFTQSEIMKACNLLDIPNEEINVYFFNGL